MYGSTVAIELNGLGGLTRWSAPDGALTPGRRALIAAAGSATGLLFGGLVWLVDSSIDPGDPLVGWILASTVRVNVFWGVLNWLPIRPLDGGHLLESLLQKVAPKRAETIARIVFTTTAAAALVAAISLRNIFIAVLAGWLLLMEFSTGRQRAPTGLPTLSYDVPPEVPEGIPGADEVHDGPVSPGSDEDAETPDREQATDDHDPPGSPH
jgi:hypothetical protein